VFNCIGFTPCFRHSLIIASVISMIFGKFTRLNHYIWCNDLATVW